MASQPVAATLPYRLGVGVMLLNTSGRVFVAKRIDTISEAWQMPQGGIDEGEDPADCAKRELWEETGVRSASILAECPEWLDYDLPDALIPKIWGGKYRGQRQKWFAMRLTGPESEINIATQHPEFSEWKWVELSELPALIVPFKRSLYERLVREFSHLA